MNKKSNPQNPARVAVIGCGYWGKNLVRNFARLNALAALADHHKERTDALIAQFGGTAKSFEDILNDKSIDAMVIATPGHTHFDLGMSALKAGKHVFLEKPMTLSAAAAETLAKKADDTKRILMVGHVLHYHAAFAKLKQLAKAGALGRLRHIVSTRFNLGKILDDEDVVWALSPHDVSMIVSLLGADPVSVTAQGDSFLRKGIIDVATLRLDYAGEVSAEIRLSWMHPVKEHKLTVIGEKAMAVFDDTLAWDEKLTLYKPELDWKNPAIIPAAGAPEKIPLQQSEPLAEECAHFLHCLATGTQPVTNHVEGLAVTRIIEKASAALKVENFDQQAARRRASS
jgi:UDP-2-acetamido-3-amino-2,3-dideoxy-glucuronate N-acetyltransferase